MPHKYILIKKNSNGDLESQIEGFTLKDLSTKSGIMESTLYRLYHGLHKYKNRAGDTDYSLYEIKKVATTEKRIKKNIDAVTESKKIIKYKLINESDECKYYNKIEDIAILIKISTSKAYKIIQNKETYNGYKIERILSYDVVNPDVNIIVDNNV